MLRSIIRLVTLGRHGRKALGDILGTFNTVKADLEDHIAHHNARAAQARIVAQASENSAAQATQALVGINKLLAGK